MRAGYYWLLLATDNNRLTDSVWKVLEFESNFETLKFQPNQSFTFEALSMKVMIRWLPKDSLVKSF